LNLKPKSIYFKTIDSLRSLVKKKLISNFADAGVQVVAIDFPSNLHTNDLLLSIWYAESAAAFDPSQDQG
jgi:hypothetical protein